MKKHFTSIFYGLTLLLLLPALLINLGLLTFINDESIRALVALEMDFSGNYITPTLNGEFYYNKPPLYNWIILLSYKLTGVVNEFTSRLPTIIFLLLYAATIFYFIKKYFTAKIAFINAFVFITCGRILFWDSMLGLIDICFSWVMFLLFMSIYHFYQKQQYWLLFLVSYCLTAIGFMLKGLPAGVFQGTTLVVFFLYKKSWKKLFYPAHFVGIGLFVLLIGSYYFAYHQYNSLENVFITLFTESSKRTVVNYGISKTILHLFTFPFEMIYHFLPWSLFIIYFFKKGVFKYIFKNEFITYCLLIFLANIIVYWTSPQVYPRYLLMLAPLLFAVFIYLHDYHEKKLTVHYRMIQALLLTLSIIILIISALPFFLKNITTVPYHYEIAGTLFAALFILTITLFRFKTERFLILFMILLVARISFNAFVLPDRNANDWGNEVRLSSIEAAKFSIGKPLFLYQDVAIDETNSFYISNTRGERLLRKQEDFIVTERYIFSPRRRKLNPPYRKVENIYLRQERFTLDVGELE